MTVDRSLSLPLHVQVRELVSAQIEDGVFGPGSRLPTEVELADRYGVHRLTVRQAMADLARSGLIDVRQGVGSFVADTTEPFDVDLAPGEWLEENQRSTRAYADRGVVIRHELVGTSRRPTRGEVARHLGIEEAMVVETVQFTDGRPSMRALHWVVSDACVDDMVPFETSGAAAFLTELAGGPMFYSWRTIGAVAASLDDVAVLQVPIGAPLVHRCGINVDGSGRPVMFVDRRFRGDQIRFIVHRTDPLPG